MNATSIALRPAPPLEMFIQWERSHFSRAEFQAGLDTETNTIRVVGGGVWTMADAERYLVQQKPLVAEARRRFGRVKVLYDVRRWVVDKPEAASQFQDINSKIYRPEDRLAAIVQSSLSKPHPRTALSTGVCQSFLSMAAAEMWLQAYSA